MPTAPYSYGLYNSDTIRLVHIYPGLWDDPIVCGLQYRSLDASAAQACSYAALSYVWGSAAIREVISLEEVETQVTLNLFCALKYLRKVNESVVLWVDALCINQDDDVERSKQVGIMQRIYHSAEMVIVFMGDGRGYSVDRTILKKPPKSKATSLYEDDRDKEFSQGLLSDWKAGKLRGERSSSNAHVWALRLIHLFSDQQDVEQSCKKLMRLSKDVRRDLFESLREFARRPWWSRIWVVQELAVSKTVIIQYGHVTESWEVLVRAASSAATLGTWEREGGLEPENLKVFKLFYDQVSSLEQTRIKWRAEGGILLIRLLQEFSDRKASDDRDKVYALLSLAKQEFQNIRPDYRLDIYETYRATALALIENSSSLICWYGDQKRKNHRRLASWIPDWSTPFDPGDKRRMEIVDFYCANRGWTLQIINREVDYWVAVATGIQMLINSLSGRSGRLPASLRPALDVYVRFLEIISGTDAYGTPISMNSYSLLRYLKLWEEHESCHAPHQLPHVRSIIRELETTDKESLYKSNYILHIRVEYGDTLSIHYSKSTSEVQLTGEIKPLLKIHHSGDSSLGVKWLEEYFLGDEKSTLKLAVATVIGSCNQLYVFCSYSGLSEERLRNRTCFQQFCKHRIFPHLKLRLSISDSTTAATDHVIRPWKILKCSYTFRENAAWLTSCQILVGLAFNPHLYSDQGFMGSARGMEPSLLRRGMAIQTIQVDSVIHCGSRLFGWADQESALDILARWLNLMVSKGFWGPNMPRTFAETLVGGHCRCDGAHVKAHQVDLGPLADWANEHRPMVPPPHQFLNDIQLATDGRRFFLTKNGSMGLGPASMQQGDTIHILPSGRTHFVLRWKLTGPVGTKPSDPLWSKSHVLWQYELIGDCYLHSDGMRDDGVPGEEDADVEGSLPFELLHQFLLEDGAPKIETIVLV